MTGKYRIDDLDPVVLESLPDWSGLKNSKIGSRKFWWGLKGNSIVLVVTGGIRSFLSIAEPLFMTFKTMKTESQPIEKGYFGLWDKKHGSLVIAKDDSLISYGSPIAEHRLMEHVHRWVDLGMPNAASFDLKVYPVAATVDRDPNQWIVKRRESQFVWSLPDSKLAGEH